MHGEDFETVVHALGHAIGSGLNFDAEYRTLLADGSVRWIATRGEIARDAGGEPARLIGTITDVTVRKRLEESLKQKADSLTIAQTVAGIATMDLEVTRQRWICSENFYELMGLPMAVPINDWDDRLRHVHPEDLDRIRRAPLETTPERPTYRCAYRVELGNGAERWIGEKVGRRLRNRRQAGASHGRAHGHHRAQARGGCAHLDRKAARPYHARHARWRVGI